MRSAGVVAVAIGLIVLMSASIHAVCVGDCTGSGTVTADDLLSEVDIGLGDAEITSCTAGAARDDQQIAVDAILVAVNHAVDGCGLPPTPTATPLRCPGAVDCENGSCCPNTTTCGMQGDCCPDGFPVDCGPSVGCCPDGATCGSKGDCCPSGFPVDCGPGNGCCPHGTTCGVNHCF